MQSLLRPILFCLLVGVLFCWHRTVSRGVQPDAAQTQVVRGQDSSDAEEPPDDAGFAIATDEDDPDAAPEAEVEPPNGEPGDEVSPAAEEPEELPAEVDSQPVPMANPDAAESASPEEIGAADAKKPLPSLSTKSATAPVSPLDAAATVEPSPESVSPSRSTFTDAVPAEPVAAGVPVETATFNGIQPGKSKMEDLRRAFGGAKQTTTQQGIVRLTYEIKPFKSVEVTLASGTVSSVLIHLEKPLPHAPLAKQLKLNDVQPVQVLDDEGQPLGHAFPERGVMFSFAAGGTQVSHILLEPVTADPFVLRAEATMGLKDSQNLADLNNALSLDPKNAHAHWLRARVYRDLGRSDEALKDIDDALAIEPAGADYIFTRADILAQLGSHGDAVQAVKQVLASEELAPLVKAQALTQLGDLLASGAAPDYKQSMENYLAAIKLADPLSIERVASVRRAAKVVLIEAHLGVACDVAHGAWQNKEPAVAKWIARAKERADDLIAHDGGTAEVRLRLCRRALAAYAGLPGSSAADHWTSEAVHTGKQLIASAADNGRKRRLQWELGSALSDAVHIAHAHSQPEKALEHGRAAAAYLAGGGKYRQKTPTDAQLLGRLYFKIGVIHAVEKKDHVSAIGWYQKAAPLLELAAPVAPPAASDQGEAFVSMGVSYWETGDRSEAIRLTKFGADMMAAAVKNKSLDASALAVPYGNLASMHAEVGDSQKADFFTELAKQPQPEGSTLR